MGTVSRDAVERPGLGTLTADVAEGRMMNDLQFSGFSFILFGGWRAAGGTELMKGKHRCCNKNIHWPSVLSTKTKPSGSELWYFFIKTHNQSVKSLIKNRTHSYECLLLLNSVMKKQIMKNLDKDCESFSRGLLPFSPPHYLSTC